MQVMLLVRDLRNEIIISGGRVTFPILMHALQVMGTDEIPLLPLAQPIASTCGIYFLIRIRWLIVLLLLLFSFLTSSYNSALLGAGHSVSSHGWDG